MKLLHILSLAVLPLCLHAGKIRVPDNLATSAKITASSQYNDAYAPKFVADGEVPEEDGHADVKKAWCVQGATHKNGADIHFAWTKVVKLGQVCYFGRTAWGSNECWKGFTVLVDDKALLKGTLKRMHGMQRIALPAGCTGKRLTLRFTSSHGGGNPGASEIMVFEKPLGKDVIAKIRRQLKGGNTPKPVDMSSSLGKKLLAGSLGFKRMIAIQRHEIRPSHVYTYHAEGLKPGGGLYVVEPRDGAPKLTQLIDSKQGIVLDANISYDGERIVFSWKKTMRDKFQIYTINVDGSNLKQVEVHNSHNMNACWLPDGGIAFLSDRKPAFAYCWVTTSPVLYRMNADGANVIRLSANYLNDFTPSVMSDGRILYSRWEYVDRPAIPIQSLWTMSQDGSGLAGFFGNRTLGPATFMEAREIGETGKVLCVLTAHNGPCRGAIGIVDPEKGANNQDAIRNLTPEVNIGKVDSGNGNRVRGPYESPFPINSKYFLVSKVGAILLRDYDGNESLTLIKKNGKLGWYTAQPIMPRRRPHVRPSMLKPGTGNWASVVLVDVYDGLGNHVKRGEVKQIEVVQEMEKSRFADKRYRAFGFQFPVVSAGATYAPKKVWGYAKVEKDGSAFFKVPTGVPIYYIALDAKGRGVQRMRTFTHFMPGETQSCVGCHPNRNYATPRNTRRPMASTRKPQELTKPEWGVRGFSFAHFVQPVLDKHCTNCHNPKKRAGDLDLSPDRTDFFNVAYDELVRKGTIAENPLAGGCSPSHFGKSKYTSWISTLNGMESNILQITPKHWGSCASKLGEVVCSGHPDKSGKNRINLSDIERRRILAWIDLNVPYYGTASSNMNNVRGYRQIVPKQLKAVLSEVGKRRCISCHKGKIPRKFYTRVTNPENNSFLLAPLAKSAGGTGKCGKVIFKDKSDPDYKAILKAFEPVKELLKETPRKDLCPMAAN